ncbi:MAG: hypothetical protein LYZ69_01975 [Nitrososphaerales archaeon]|nr:hypothetical protein [Nitrososphaerales archaeon]
MRSSRLFAAMVILAVCTVAVVNGPLFAGGSAGQRHSASSTFVESVQGLRLYLSVNTTTPALGRAVQVRVEEFNTLSAPNNVSRGQSWTIEGLGMTACYSSVYPFGVALFEGTYTAANVTQAKPLEMFPIVPCPLLIRLITGYSFEAQSSAAVVLPGNGPALPMVANATLAGTYSADSATTPLSLPPGAYTIVAGDEWGSLAFLYFNVE